jgi:hypothetical protein
MGGFEDPVRLYELRSLDAQAAVCAPATVADTLRSLKTAGAPSGHNHSLPRRNT